MDLFTPMHLLIILVIVLLIFGPAKLAGLGKGMGEGIRNFKDSVRDGDKNPPPSSPAPPASTPEKKS